MFVYHSSILPFATEAQVAHKSKGGHSTNHDGKWEHSRGECLLVIDLRDLIVTHLHIGIDTVRILRPWSNGAEFLCLFGPEDALQYNSSNSKEQLEACENQFVYQVALLILAASCVTLVCFRMTVAIEEHPDETNTGHATSCNPDAKVQTLCVVNLRIHLVKQCHSVLNRLFTVDRVLERWSSPHVVQKARFLFFCVWDFREEIGHIWKSVVNRWRALNAILVRLGLHICNRRIVSCVDSHTRFFILFWLVKVLACLEISDFFKCIVDGLRLCVWHNVALVIKSAGRSVSQSDLLQWSIGPWILLISLG